MTYVNGYNLTSFFVNKIALFNSSLLECAGVQRHGMQAKCVLGIKRQALQGVIKCKVARNCTEQNILQ